MRKTEPPGKKTAEHSLKNLKIRRKVEGGKSRCGRMRNHKYQETGEQKGKGRERK